MRGFTLIEILLYCAILSLMLVGVFELTLLLNSATEVEYDTQLFDEGNHLIEKIDTMLSGASVVYEPALGATSTLLRFKNSESFYRFELVKGKLWLKKDYGEPLDLSINLDSVDAFVVEHTKSGNTPSWVKVVITIKGMTWSVIRYTRL